jgi:hypothetical protein
MRRNQAQEVSARSMWMDKKWRKDEFRKRSLTPFQRMKALT